MTKTLKLSRGGESFLAVIPSHRVTTEEYLRQLQLNGVTGSVFGRGTARVVDRDGRRFRVTCLIVRSHGESDAAKAEKIARLCGITVTLLDRRSWNY